MWLKVVLLTLCLVWRTHGSTDEHEGPLKCDVARMKCAFRRGCGMALQNYVIECADVISGRTRRCSDFCQKSLIALTSTNEGKVSDPQMLI